jgi:hypothetical protein
VVATPLAVCVRLKEPAVAVHITPAFAASPETVAARLVIAPVCKDAGALLMPTVMLVPSVMVAETVTVGSVTEVAVTVTVCPAEASTGAV